jgi:hypothetical protein
MIRLACLMVASWCLSWGTNKVRVHTPYCIAATCVHHLSGSHEQGKNMPAIM